MKTLGIGIITAAGRGMESISCDMEIEPTDIYQVAPDTLKDKAILKNMRRADRFSKMGVLSAHDALVNAGIEIESGNTNLGIIVTTAFGPHGTTFKFLDDILEFGDNEVSPTKFSHSIHNVTASYIASSLESRGPASTITKFNNAFSEGLNMAAAWLAEERCNHVLLGYIEELSPAMTHINEMLKARGDRLQTFNLSMDPNASFTEGAVFVVLSGDQGDMPDNISDIESLMETLNNE